MWQPLCVSQLLVVAVGVVVRFVGVGAVAIAVASTFVREMKATR